MELGRKGEEKEELRKGKEEKKDVNRTMKSTFFSLFLLGKRLHTEPDRPVPETGLFQKVLGRNFEPLPM